ncbi:hypothetical protein BU25DRAFT_420841 [Macroventuria anomochaeta]|uniref:Uncharacterized protein n=1 Tax=Macroventuria anomochaeta TaxID=301207 RepID=A0ACB6S259_9PLEO|nr:uncharacterized protein BU25DRAFT_420841 [Macroventuria anomochaeta]KAF2628356.1 hypothetical protein BU25DRAFT_420841 [Macroventuria anomochaeta]
MALIPNSIVGTSAAYIYPPSHFALSPIIETTNTATGPTDTSDDATGKATGGPQLQALSGRDFNQQSPQQQPHPPSEPPTEEQLEDFHEHPSTTNTAGPTVAQASTSRAARDSWTAFGRSITGPIIRRHPDRPRRRYRDAYGDFRFSYGGRRRPESSTYGTPR